MTVRILCNLPLECFEDRSRFDGVELCSYGPPDRMWVDGVHWPFDVDFDPSAGSWPELERRLPRGFRPDFVLIYWPDQEPLPAGMQLCPVPVVGVISDYNVTLQFVAGLWPLFDVLLCDRAGVELFRRLPFADVRWFCQFTFKRPFHRIWPDVGARDLDVGFAGNLHPEVQRERLPWLDRLRALRSRGIGVEVRSGIRGEAYGRFLNRLRIGWNRSVRGEMNLRAFEVPACGALLFQERENLEVRDFLAPGDEVVLYGDDDLEQLVLEHLCDEPKRARMARAGHARIQDFSMGRRLGALCELLSQRGPGRPGCGAGDATLARAVAMLPTWAPGPAAAAAAVEACRLLPGDARALNALALATLRWRGDAGAGSAFDLLRAACDAAPRYVPAARNLAALVAAARRDDLRAPAEQLSRTRALSAQEWSDVEGPLLPLGSCGAAVATSRALQRALRGGDPRAFAGALATPALERPR